MRVFLSALWFVGVNLPILLHVPLLRRRLGLQLPDTRDVAVVIAWLRRTRKVDAVMLAVFLLLVGMPSLIIGFLPFRVVAAIMIIGQIFMITSTTHYIDRLSALRTSTLG